MSVHLYNPLTANNGCSGFKFVSLADEITDIGYKIGVTIVWSKIHYIRVYYTHLNYSHDVAVVTEVVSRYRDPQLL